MSQIQELRKWRDETADEARYSTAELVADKILTITSDSADAFVYAKILYDQGSFLRAANILDVGAHIEEIKCRRLAVRSLIAAGKLDRALELVLPTDAQLQFLEGEIWTSKNSFESGKIAYLKALRLDQACYEAFEKLITHRLLSQAEELELIKELDLMSLDHCADIVKNIYSSRLSGSISSNSLVRDALTNLGEVYDLANNTDVMVHRAELLYMECNFTKAKALCEKILEIDAYNTSIYPVYVGTLYELRDSKALFRIGHQLAEESPKSAVTWIAIGSYYLQIGNHAEARRNFSKATIIDPLSITAWLGFAHTFANEGEHERSITAYSTASRLFPGSHLPYMFLGMQYLYLNNLSLANEYLMKSGALCNFNDPLLLNELGVLNYHRNDLVQAKLHIERSLEMAAEYSCDKTTWNPMKANMGYVHRRLGNYREALDLFEQVSRQSPGDANITVALGLVNMNLGDKDAAIMYFNTALGMKRSDPVATEMLKKAMKGIDPIEDVLARASIDWGE